MIVTESVSTDSKRYTPVEFAFVAQEIDCTFRHRLKSSGPNAAVTVQTAIQDKSDLNPEERRKLTDEFVSQLLVENPILKRFGISVSPEMRIVEGFVIPPPSIVYAHGVRKHGRYRNKDF